MMDVQSALDCQGGVAACMLDTQSSEQVREVLQHACLTRSPLSKSGRCCSMHA